MKIKNSQNKTAKNLEDQMVGYMGVRILLSMQHITPKLLVIKAKQTMQAALS
jgi:hypothetical protein